MKICCVTGSRPQNFPWKYGEGEQYERYLSDLLEKAEELIEDGVTYFISGGSIGVDMDFAEIILELKRKYPFIKLEIAVPCAKQSLKWQKADKERYNEILDKADVVTVLSQSYTAWCMQKRNEYMVDKSDVVLAVWNGKQKGGTYNTIRYSLRKNKEICYLLL